MDIPEDVVALILVRLPVKSLLKFRCVCKAWCSLIGSHGFIDMHLQHPFQGRENEYLVLKRFDDDENTMMSFYCSDLLKKAAPDWRAFPPRMISLGGPINGIFLVGGDRDQTGSLHEHPLYLCNPATREIRKIPDRPFGVQRARPCKYSVTWYDCKRRSVGFGYDPRTKDYKVVSIMHFIDDDYYTGDEPGGTLTIEIYDLGSNSWRVADTVFPTIVTRPDPDADMEHHPVLSYSANLSYDQLDQGMFREFMCGVFLNGSIHWNALGGIKAILAFNISDEVMRAFHLPRGTSTYQNASPRSLFVLDDSLAFVQRVMGNGICQYYPHTTSVYVWVMVEYGDEESWTKTYFLQTGVFMDVLASWDNLLICETIDGEVASCNPKEDAPHQLRKHHHIKKYVPELRNQQKESLRWNSMGALVMNKQSLVRLS